jgi:hypothetical protein
MKIKFIILTLLLSFNSYAGFSEQNFEGKIVEVRSGIWPALLFSLDTGMPQACKGARNDYIIIEHSNVSALSIVTSSRSSDTVKGLVFLSQHKDCTVEWISRNNAVN